MLLRNIAKDTIGRSLRQIQNQREIFLHRLDVLSILLLGQRLLMSTSYLYPTRCKLKILLSFYRRAIFVDVVETYVRKKKKIEVE